MRKEKAPTEDTTTLPMPASAQQRAERFYKVRGVSAEAPLVAIKEDFTNGSKNTERAKARNDRKEKVDFMGI